MQRSFYSRTSESDHCPTRARGAILFAFIHQAEQRIKIDAIALKEQTLGITYVITLSVQI